jgi:D-alanyl-D-alanine endopeptidase (penicillin-binding protein 7)
MIAKLSPAALLLALAAICAALPVQAAVETAKTRAEADRLAKIAANAKVRQVLVVRSGRQGGRRIAVIRSEPAKPSFGQMIGLHESADSLELKSGVALILDQDTNEVLFSKNSEAVLPIASLTKLMTAVVVTEAQQPLDEIVTITDEDIDTEKGSRSRLRVGTQLRREDMLHLALMSSENRAANALGRSYPGGLAVFVAAMNQKARALGMNDTHYVEPIERA